MALIYNHCYPEPHLHLLWLHSHHPGYDSQVAHLGMWTKEPVNTEDPEKGGVCIGEKGRQRCRSRGDWRFKGVRFIVLGCQHDHHPFCNGYHHHHFIIFINTTTVATLELLRFIEQLFESLAI
eukprot:1139355-Pelagomonas_calceolata.AAC.1